MTAGHPRILHTAYDPQPPAILEPIPRNDAWASTHKCHEGLKHGSTDIERDGHRIEIMTERQSVLLPRFTVVNNRVVFL